MPQLQKSPGEVLRAQEEGHDWVGLLREIGQVGGTYLEELRHAAVEGASHPDPERRRRAKEDFAMMRFAPVGPYLAQLRKKRRLIGEMI